MKWKKIKIVRDSGEIIYEGPFNELPLREEYIVEKSVELYKEPEPCIIYRTHIMKKFYIEVMDYLQEKNIKKGASLDCDDCQELLAPLMLDTTNSSLTLM